MPRVHGVIAANDLLELFPVEHGPVGLSPVGVVVHSRLHIDQRAELAQRLMVAALSGGASMGHMLTKAACDMAEDAHSEFTSRGWALPVPSYEEIVKAVDQAAGNRMADEMRDMHSIKNPLPEGLKGSDDERPPEVSRDPYVTENW